MNVLLSTASGDPPWACLSLSNKRTKRHDPATTPPRLRHVQFFLVSGPPWGRRRQDGWTFTCRASTEATAGTTPESQCGNVRVCVAPTTLVLVDECDAPAPSSTDSPGPGGLLVQRWRGDVCLDLTQELNENITETEGARLSLYFGRAQNHLCG